MIVSCHGIGIGTESPIAIGEAWLLCPGPKCTTPNWVSEQQVDQEVARFEQALADTREQLKLVRGQIPTNAPSEIAEFIDTHLLMVEDKAISSGVINLIRHTFASAEWALKQQCDAMVAVFDQMEDPYLRTRRDDLDHVVKRIQAALSSQQNPLSNVLAGQIILAEDLSPADVIVLHNQQIAGFVTDFGGPMSHSAILARSLGLPAVVSARNASTCLRQGELLILDAEHGCVMAGCDAHSVEQFQHRRAFHQERALQLRRHSSEPAQTADGQPIELLANIELTADVAAARDNGADGIGLYRTEFLYMNRRDLPDEEEHFAAYREVLDGMQGKPVTIRTLDLGADKPAFEIAQRESGGNPALGLRAIRLCLKEPGLFRPQVRAILRASAFGEVRLMLPMLTNLWEVEQAKAIVRRCMHELQIEEVAFDPQLRIGGMIEVPAAALAAGAFAQALDFLSIGTNDLIQYTLAIDRINDEVNYLYDPLHPAILQLIQHVIDACRSNNTPLSMCGEMAGDSNLVPLLVGMGLNSLSMQPGALLDVKQQLLNWPSSKLKAQAGELMDRMYQEDPLSILARWQQQM